MSINFSDSTSSDEGTVDLFGGLNAADIADDPYDVPDDTYEVAVKEAKIAKTKTGKMGMTITYLITDAGNESIIGRQVGEWYQVGPYENQPGTEAYNKEKDRRSYLKRRLTSLGVPESKMGPSFSPNDLVGIEAVIKTKKKDENVRITALSLKDSGAGNTSGGSGFSFS